MTANSWDVYILQDSNLCFFYVSHFGLYYTKDSSKVEMFVLQNNEVCKKLKKANSKISLPLKLKRLSNDKDLIVNANLDGPTSVRHA